MLWNDDPQMSARLPTWIQHELERVELDSTTIRSHAPSLGAYARVFFPVTRGDNRPVRWSSALDCVITGQTRWDAAAARAKDLGTASGDLPLDVALSLVEALEADADPITFAYWVGYGDTRRPRSTSTAVLPPDGRELWFARTRGAQIGLLTERVGRGPMRWYPDHRQWAVTGDVYDRSVIVSGAAGVVEAVLAHPGLEAVRVPPSLPRSVLA